MGCTPSNIKATDASVPVKSVKILKKNDQISGQENPESAQQLDSKQQQNTQNIQASQQDSEIGSDRNNKQYNGQINQNSKFKRQESKRTSVVSYQNIVMSNMQQTQSTQYNSKLGSRKSILRIDDDAESNYLTSLNELDVAQEKSILRSNMNRRKTQEPIEARKMSIIQAYQQRHSILYTNDNLLQQIQEQYYREQNNNNKRSSQKSKGEINETSEQDETEQEQEEEEQQQQNQIKQNQSIIHEMKESDTSKKTEDSLIKKSVQALLISLDTQVPRYVITEQFLKTRKKVRDMRKEEENPAPFISTNLKTSSIIIRRQLLEKEINTQEKEMINQFQSKQNNANQVKA